MKKLNASILLLASLLITSCDNVNDLSSSSSNTSNSTLTTTTTTTTTTTSHVNESLTIDELFSILKEVGKSESFQVTFSNDDVSSDVIYDSSYYLNKTTEEGIIMINNYNSSSIYKKLGYHFTFKNNEVKVGSIATAYDENYNETTVLSIKDVNPLKVFNDNLINEINDFEEVSDAGNGEIIINNFTTLNVFLGLYFKQVNQGELVFGFLTYDDDFNLVKMDAGEGVIKYQNPEKNEELVKFSNEFEIPGEELNNLAFSIYSDGEYNTKTTLTQFENDTEVLSQTINLDVSSSYYRLYSDNLNGMPTDELYVADENGIAISQYISYENKLVEESVGQSLGLGIDIPLALLVASQDLDTMGFRSTSENTYKYWGADALTIASALSGLTFNMTLDSLTLETVNNKASKLTLVSTVSEYDDMEGGTIEGYTEIVIELNDHAKAKPEIKPYETTAETQEIKSILDNFESARNYVIEALTNNEESYVKYYVTEDAIINDSIDAFGDRNINGYVNKNNGYSDFMYVNNKPTPTAPLIEGSISDLLKIDVAPELFELNEDKTELKIRNYVKGATDHIILGPDTGLEIVENTFTYKLNDGTISGIKYTGSVAAFGIVVEAEFKITYANSAEELGGSELVNILNELESMSSEWSEPTNFMTIPSVYELLVKMYGEEVASEIPYLYNKDFYLGMGISTITNTLPDGSEGDIYSITLLKFDGNLIDTDNYFGRYKELLLEKGYEYDEESDSYIKGIVSITVGSNYGEGITFRKV